MGTLSKRRHEPSAANGEIIPLLEGMNTLLAQNNKLLASINEYVRKIAVNTSPD
jgi:hypothetical protein